MKKSAELILCVILATVSGSALAQSGISDNSALEKIISGTDAQIAPALNKAPELPQPYAVPAMTPAPSMAQAGSQNIELMDVTEKWIFQGTIISVYPTIYKMIHREENSEIIRVFHFADPQGTERRIEVFYTGGDWMRYGLTYFVTNAGPYKDQADAYFISDLSTADPKNGSIAPKVNPRSAQKVADFIINDFLDAYGNVKAGFNSIATSYAGQ